MVDPTEIAANFVEEEENEDCICDGRTIAAIIKLIKNLLPHIFLFSSLLFYIIMGASYFYYHESAFEVETKTRELSDFYELRKNFSEKIWTLQNSNDAISREKFDKIQKQLFDDLVSKIFSLQSNQYITESNLLDESRSDKLIWSFSNSIFFATSLVTTIGYTYKLTPATIYGKIGVIIFAMFGIPLLLITVADIGRFLSIFLLSCHKTYVFLKGKMLSVLQKHIRFLSEMGKQDDDVSDIWDYFHRISSATILLITLFYIGISGAILSFCKGWSLLDGCFICFNVIARIGTGNKIPSEDDNVFFIVLYIIFSLSLSTMYFDLSGTMLLQKIHWVEQKFNDMRSCLFRCFQRRNSVKPEGRF